MPELPEVETVRRQLADALLGARFESVGRVESSMLRDCAEADVRDRLPGRSVLGFERLGKFIVVRLDADVYVTLHLGMTGQFLVDPGEDGAHTRFSFVLESGRGRPLTLEFRDMRKFGRVHVTVGGPAPRLADLGPDAWLGDWDEEYLAARLARRTAPVKAFLLDQRHVAGIGNIYADEILWWTGISPLRRAGELAPAEIEGLTAEIRHRLGEGVRLLGCTLSDFVDTAGEPGTFQEWLRAYGKQGTACTRCGAVFVRTVVAGRGTAYCPGCQK